MHKFRYVTNAFSLQMSSNLTRARTMGSVRGYDYIPSSAHGSRSCVENHDTGCLNLSRHY